jgi:hypothetical protein
MHSVKLARTIIGRVHLHRNGKLADSGHNHAVHLRTARHDFKWEINSPPPKPSRNLSRRRLDCDTLSTFVKWSQPMNKIGQRPANRLAMRLSTLFLCLTICAILTAWFVDHRELKSRIEPPQPKIATSYSLSHASPELMAVELQNLYPKQKFTAATPIGGTKKNLVVVLAEMNIRKQLEIIIRHFDRPGTDMIESDTVAKNQTPQENR